MVVTDKDVSLLYGIHTLGPDVASRYVAHSPGRGVDDHRQGRDTSH